MPKLSPKASAKSKKAPSPKVTKALQRAKVPEPVKTTAKNLGEYFYANGKRKTSVATVRLHQNGKGTLTINNRSFKNYFPVFTDQDKVLSPLRVTNSLKVFDISAKVKGGGIHSQAEAIRHGIAKALLEYSSNARSILKPLGFLTRDSRVKERKKYGLKRARRAPQFSKR